MYVIYGIRLHTLPIRSVDFSALLSAPRHGRQKWRYIRTSHTDNSLLRHTTAFSFIRDITYIRALSAFSLHTGTLFHRFFTYVDVVASPTLYIATYIAFLHNHFHFVHLFHIWSSLVIISINILPSEGYIIGHSHFSLNRRYILPLSKASHHILLSSYNFHNIIFFICFSINNNIIFFTDTLICHLILLHIITSFIFAFIYSFRLQIYSTLLSIYVEYFIFVHNVVFVVI